MICSCGISFDPIVGSRRLTFGFHGIYQGTAVLYDHQTDSLWMILTGEAFSGELEGTVLAHRPIGRHTEWLDWRTAHPDTDVMRPDPQLSRATGRHPGYFTRQGARSGSPYLPPEFSDTIHTSDPRLLPYALVYGLTVASASRAYPIDRLREHPVVEELIGAVPATIWFDRASRSASAFDRRGGDQLLSFDARGEGRFEDRETRSQWNMEGQCVSGPLRGEKLEPLDGLMAEWYGWIAHHPESTIWAPGNSSPVR